MDGNISLIFHLTSDISFCLGYQIEIVLGKSEKFDEIMSAAAAAQAAQEPAAEGKKWQQNRNPLYGLLL